MPGGGAAEQATPAEMDLEPLKRFNFIKILTHPANDKRRYAGSRPVFQAPPLPSGFCTEVVLMPRSTTTHGAATAVGTKKINSYKTTRGNVTETCFIYSVTVLPLSDVTLTRR